MNREVVIYNIALLFFSFAFVVVDVSVFSVWLFQMNATMANSQILIETISSPTH